MMINLDPWTLPPSRKRTEKLVDGPMPATVSVVRSNLIYVEKMGLPPALMNRILRIAAFQNPEFYKAQAMRLSTFDKPRVIGCGEDMTRHLALPRGCLDDLLALLKSHKIKPVVQDERLQGETVEATFHGTLREKQLDAVAEIIRHDEGFLCAPTAFGKTAVAAWLIAERKVNTLILVHRQQLLDQWRERLAMFLEMPIDQIGQIGAGKHKRTGKIDVAVIPSLYRDQEVKDFMAIESNDKVASQRFVCYCLSVAGKTLYVSCCCYWQRDCFAYASTATPLSMSATTFRRSRSRR